MLLSETKMRALLLLARGGCHKFRRSGFPEISDATLTAMARRGLILLHRDVERGPHGHAIRFVRVLPAGKAFVDAYRMGRKGVV